MKIGMNLLLWTPFVTEEHFGILKKLKATGFDGVEVPLFGGDVKHYKKVAKAIKDNGLACTTCTVMPDAEHNPISADPKSRSGAVEYLKWVIDCNAALGSEVLCGPYYQPLGAKFFSGKGPTQEEKERAAEVHRTIADYAQKAGVVLAIECLNRFECYFLNTIADGVALRQAGQSPQLSASCTIRSTPTSRRRTPSGASRRTSRCSGTCTSPRTTAVRRARDTCRSQRSSRLCGAGATIGG